MKKIVFLFVLPAIIFSCNKIEGEGGTSSISGKLIVNDVNGAGELQSTFAGADEDVFIIYGEDNTTYSDKVSTSYDGSYRFDNLVIGTYKLFSYSKCDTCNSETTEVIVKAIISDKKEVIYAADIIIEQ